MHWANLMLSAVVHRHMKTDGEIDVFKMVQKVKKNGGKIDAFNSGPESDENGGKIDGFNNGPESYEKMVGKLLVCACFNK